MSVENDEWYYGENNQRSTPPVDIGRLLRGDGFDDENDIFRSGAERQKEVNRGNNEKCACEPDGMFEAAQLLLAKISNNPAIFPSTSAQMDSFAQIGGYAGGPWHKWVNADRSRATNRDEFGFIELGANCKVSNHRCRIRMIGDTEFVLDGMPVEVILSDIGRPLDDIDIFDSDSEQNPFDSNDSPFLIDDDEEDDEDAERYDARAHGDLEESIELPFESPDRDLIFEWRESSYSDEQIATYVSLELGVEEIAHLSRYMPVHQVAAWIDEFGEDSMEAATMLHIALGGLHHPDLKNPDSFDVALDKLIKDLRKITAKHFRDFKKNLVAAQEQARKKAKKNAPHDL
jgi:hypothetical protein